LGLRETKRRVSDEDCIMNSSETWYTSPYFSTVMKVKEDEIGGACRAHGRGVKCIQNSGPET
jgi:hypothetical protein